MLGPVPGRRWHGKLGCLSLAGNRYRGFFDVELWSDVWRAIQFAAAVAILAGVQWLLEAVFGWIFAPLPAVVDLFSKIASAGFLVVDGIILWHVIVIFWRGMRGESRGGV